MNVLWVHSVCFKGIIHRTKWSKQTIHIDDSYVVRTHISQMPWANTGTCMLRNVAATLATVIIIFNVSISFVVWISKRNLSFSVLSFPLSIARSSRCRFLHFLCGIRVCVHVHLCHMYTFNLFCIAIILSLIILHTYTHTWAHWKSVRKYACGIDHFQQVSYSVVVAPNNDRGFYSSFNFVHCDCRWCCWCCLWNFMWCFMNFPLFISQCERAQANSAS